MIIYRYLSRQLFASTVSVAFVLTLVLVVGRFIKYLGEAVSGALESDILLLLMAYRLPSFMELILPLAFFFGILLAYGRLYVENEMTVLNACGYSPYRIVKFTLVPTLLMALLVAFLSIWLTPWGNERSAALITEQKGRSSIEMLTPGKFHTNASGGVSRTVYAQSMDAETSALLGVFVSEVGGGVSTTIQADKALRTVGDSGERFLILENGSRAEGEPGELNYKLWHFDRYTVRLAPVNTRIKPPKRSSKPMAELWISDALAEKAELQWRLSLPLMVIVVMVIAVVLSRVNPRQGRFVRLLPAVILYLSYLMLLITAKGWIEDGRLSLVPGLWLIHSVFICLALGLLFNAQYQWVDNWRLLRGRKT